MLKEPPKYQQRGEGKSPPREAHHNRKRDQGCQRATTVDAPRQSGIGV